MAESIPYGRSVSPDDLNAMRRQAEYDNRLRAVTGVRGAVRLIRTDEEPAETFRVDVDTERNLSAPYDWADDPTIARAADSPGPRPQNSAVAVGANVLLFLTAPDDLLPRPQS